MRASALLLLARFSLAIFVYDGVVRPLLAPTLALPVLVGGLSPLTLILFLSSVCHAGYCLGWRHAAAFLALSAVISWAFEQAGVETGVVYGRYGYTDILGVKLGHVPILIPIAWFMMIWPSHVIANLIVSGRPDGSPPSSFGLVGASLLGAVVMTAWDLVVDPILSGPDVQAWIWQDGGPYFGVPARNFVGWLATTFSVYIAYRFVERRWPPRPDGPLDRPAVAVPLVAYGSMLLANLLAGAAPEALLVIGPFVMGLPLLAATIRLLEPPRRTGAPDPST